jgi:hypothetical protein
MGEKWGRKERDRELNVRLQAGFNSSIGNGLQGKQENKCLTLGNKRTSFNAGIKKVLKAVLI